MASRTNRDADATVRNILGFLFDWKVRRQTFSSGSSFSKGKCQNRCEFAEKFSQFSDAKLTQHTILRSLTIVSIVLLIP
jgi:hypothetical protein